MLGVLGDEWTLLVVQQALLGARRFGEFKSRLPISNSVLTSRLRSLTEEGLFERREYQASPQRFEYAITTRGRSLWPMLLCIWDWELRWVPDHVQELPRMHHDLCGDVFTPLVTCRSCDAVVDEKEIAAQWGPSGTWPRSIPVSSTRRRSEVDQLASPGLFPQTMSVLGNRWGFALVVAAFVGMSRFTDFQTGLRAPPGSVADRLAVLSANGVFAGDGTRYRLTEKGRELFGVVVTAQQWAQRWLEAADGPAVLLSHGGHRFTVALRCGQCRERLRAGHITTIG
ncbi:winged helix-turn-helix transcriptional regulator [Mycobacterium sp. IDR2000157661]|uniref:winged helix-turn-helix transcriptional regulator n=1 Tax=Mycobacterium sp. IDR2000157661 TaxID=2867005 RepID=UPI001EEF21DD|nr:winged helix-turn-helix transcriptional regulator [Mycobacterium sp. IDR2000157661]ULE35701.1 winged helix-turn-helix transcriptional regulator [Mycobacterium sp. IDR2000157661]